MKINEVCSTLQNLVCLLFSTSQWNYSTKKTIKISSAVQDQPNNYKNKKKQTKHNANALYTLPSLLVGRTSSHPRKSPSEQSKTRTNCGLTREPTIKACSSRNKTTNNFKTWRVRIRAQCSPNVLIHNVSSFIKILLGNLNYSKFVITQ